MNFLIIFYFFFFFSMALLPFPLWVPVFFLFFISLLVRTWQRIINGKHGAVLRSIVSAFESAWFDQVPFFPL